MGLYPENITVLIVDDEPFFRETLVSYLKEYKNITPIAAASDGAEALKILEKIKVKVILSDVRMPNLDGIGLAQEVAIRKPECRIVALTTFEDEEAMVEMLNAGAYGYVLKSSPPKIIVEAILSAAQGGTTISPHSATALRKYLTRLSGPKRDTLPMREHQVLTLLHMGKNNNTIASDLNIAETTVKKTVARLMQSSNRLFTL